MTVAPDQIMPYTSCAIRFTDVRGAEYSQVYRHRHGHPENVLTNLDHLRTVLQITDTYRNPSYTAAQFVFIDKLWYLWMECRTSNAIETELHRLLTSNDESDWEELESPEYLLGHGVSASTELRGDEEYLYEVALLSEKEWTVRVARLNQDTEDWLFEGILTVALSQFE